MGAYQESQFQKRPKNLMIQPIGGKEIMEPDWVGSAFEDGKRKKVRRPRESKSRSEEILLAVSGFGRFFPPGWEYLAKRPGINATQYDSPHLWHRQRFVKRTVRSRHSCVYRCLDLIRNIQWQFCGIWRMVSVTSSTHKE